MVGEWVSFFLQTHSYIFIYTFCISFLEFLNLCDPEKFKMFTSWDGNALNLQHIKLERISKKQLLKMEQD